MGKRKWLYWLPTLVWMAMIFVLSNRTAVQASGIDWQDFVIKKTAHFVEYGILAGLMYWSCIKTVSVKLSKLIIVVWILTVAYAMSDEFHQSFIPGRGPAIRDVFIDSLGAATVLGFIYKHRAV